MDLCLHTVVFNNGLVRQLAAQGEATRRSPKNSVSELGLDALARGIEEWIFGDYAVDPFTK